MLLNYLCPQANLKSPSTLFKYKLPMIYRNLRRDVIDHMISQFPGLQREDLYKVGVTDAAANMKKAITESKEISDQLTHADHLLNTCLTKSVEKSEGINCIIKKYKELSQRTHQSSLDWRDIKKACVEANIEPVKIIQPIETR